MDNQQHLLKIYTEVCNSRPKNQGFADAEPWFIKLFGHLHPMDILAD
jgi:hypothetical protein